MIQLQGNTSANKDDSLPRDQQNKKCEEQLKQTNDMLAQSNPFSEEWRHFTREALHYLYGNQLKDQFRGTGFQRIQINKLAPAFHQEIAVQLNRKITMKAEPVADDDKDYADAFGSYLQWIFDNHLKYQERIMPKKVLDAKYSGIYVERPFWNDKYRWDAEKKEWMGEVDTEVINPLYFGHDPEATDYVEYSDCEYVVIQKTMSTAKAIAKWPQYKKYIESEAVKFNTIKDKEMSQYSDWYNASLGNDTGTARDPDAKGMRSSDREGAYSNLIQGITKNSGQVDSTENQHIVVTEFLFKDRSEKQDPEAPELELEQYPEGAIEQASEEELKVSKVKDPSFFKAGTKKGDLLTDDIRLREDRKVPRFPFGRRIVRIGNLIANPKEEDQRYPYKKWDLILGVNLPLPHNLRGQNQIELARGLQNWLNAGASGLASHLLLSGSPITMIEDGALPRDKKNKKRGLWRVPGAVWKVCKGAIGRRAIETLDPPQLSQGALQIMEMITGQIQDLAGGENITLGKTSKGEQTGTEVAILAENAAQRQSLPSRLMDQHTVRVFEHIAELVQTHKKVGEIVRVVGEQHKNKLMEFNSKMKSVRFDLKLHVVDAMPFSKMTRKQEARDIFETLANTVGPAAAKTALMNYLDACEAPQKEEIIGEFDQALQQQAEAAQRQAQAEEQMAKADLQIKAEGVEAKKEATRAQERQNVRDREAEQARNSGRTYSRDAKKPK